MGTRGIFGVRIDGTDKLAYNHYDSYPSGLGDSVLGDLKKMLAEKGQDWISEKARAVACVIGDSEPSAEQIGRFKRYADLSVSEQRLTDWYCLLRNLHRGS